MPVLTQQEMDDNLIVWRRNDEGTPYHHCCACDKWVDDNHIGGRKHQGQLHWAKERMASEAAAPPPPPAPPQPAEIANTPAQVTALAWARTLRLVDMADGTPPLSEEASHEICHFSKPFIFI